MEDGDGEVAQLCPTFCDPMDCSLPGFPSMGFSRQEYERGLPFPSPGYLPNPGIEPRSPTLEVDSLLAEPQGKPKNTGVDLPDLGIELGSPVLQVDSLPTELSIRGAYICKMVAYKPCFEAPGQYCRSLCLGTWFEVHQIVLNINFGEGTLCKIQSGSTLSADPSSLM